MSAVLGADELSRRFKAVSSPATRRAFFKDYGLQTLRIAKRKLKPHNKTTGSGTSSTGKYRMTDDRVEVSFGRAAVFLEHGTRPHRIQARRGKALKFVSKAGIARGQARLTGTARRSAGSGDVTFVTLPRFVNHPGTDATPFLLPAARAALKSAGIDSRIVKEWNDAA